MDVTKLELRQKGLPWLSWFAAIYAAYVLKRFYSQASAGDLAWILAPTARMVGWLRGETLVAGPAGWAPRGGSYVIAPACAGVNFLIVALCVAVLGFCHRLGSPIRRLTWWMGSLAGAWALTIAVNTARIVAAVELYRVGPVAGLTPGQAHRLLGVLVYLGALWGLFVGLDRLTGGRPGTGAVWLVAALYLGMTVVTPLLNGVRPDGRYVEHAMMVLLVTISMIGLSFLGRRYAPRRREKT